MVNLIGPRKRSHKPISLWGAVYMKYERMLICEHYPDAILIPETISLISIYRNNIDKHKSYQIDHEPDWEIEGLHRNRFCEDIFARLIIWGGRHSIRAKNSSESLPSKLSNPKIRFWDKAAINGSIAINRLARLPETVVKHWTATRAILQRPSATVSNESNSNVSSLIYI